MKVINSKARVKQPAKQAVKQPAKRKATVAAKKPARKDFVPDKISSTADLSDIASMSEVYFTNFSDDDDTTLRHVSEAERAIHFDSVWYLSAYPDVRDAGIEPVEHFLQHGMFEGRSPNAAFNAESYVNANPDIAAFPFGPFMHYVCFGYREKRALS